MTCVSLSDLVKLSFDDCELKNIKFQVLYYSLQVIVHQLNLDDVMVEFKGKDSHFIMNEVNSTSEATKTNMIFTETIGLKGKFGLSRRSANEKPQDLMTHSRQVVVIENGKIVRQENKTRSSSPSTAALSRIEEGRIRNMQAQMDHLGSQVLPSNENVLEMIRESREEKPVTELISAMEITKRMSEAEEEIDRIASLLETVTKEYSELRKIMDKIQEDFGQDIDETLHQLKLVSGYISNIRPRDIFYQTLLNRRLISEKTDNEASQKDENKSLDDHYINTDSPNMSSKTESMGDNRETKAMNGHNNESETDEIKESDIFLPTLLSENFQSNNIEHKKADDKKKTERTTNKGLLEVIKPLSENTPVSVKTINKLAQQLEQLKLDNEILIVQVNTLSKFSEIILSGLTESKPNIEVLKEELREIRLSPSEYTKTKSWKRDVLDIHTEICYRIDNIEGDISKYTGKMILQDEIHEETIQNIIDRVETLETELNSAIKDINVLKLYESNDKDVILETLGLKLAALDEDVGVMGMRVQNTSKDIKSHEIILKILKDDVLALKTVKLDRFELEELLSDKANIQELNNKVSNDHYTQAYRFLTKSIERNAEKLSSQTLLWEKVVDNFNFALENKLSLEDFNDLAKKLITEIRRIQTDLVLSTYGNHGPPARGGKQKYIRSLQCISCDQDVIMKKENDFPNLPMLPRLAGHNIKARQKELMENKDVKSNSPKAMINHNEKSMETGTTTTVTSHEEFRFSADED